MTNEEIKDLNQLLSELSATEKYCLSDELKLKYLSEGADPYILFFIDGRVGQVDFLNKYGMKEAFENLVSTDQTGEKKRRDTYLQLIKEQAIEGLKNW